MTNNLMGQSATKRTQKRCVLRDFKFKLSRCIPSVS